MKLYLKYMISRRCKIMVKQELKKLNIKYLSIELGEIEIIGDLPESTRNQLKINLLESGLELLDNKRSVLVERIKNTVIEMIERNAKVPMANYSAPLSKKLGYDYTYLSNVFSEVKGITIQQYIQMIKIEKVKELILYNELSLKQIAAQMNYSSPAHLSHQFKKITGLTPTEYKQMKNHQRSNLEEM